jgi:hypothetical protein
MLGPGKGVRRLPSLIEGFCNYTAGRNSPEIFRRWAAIGMIAAAMERKVWTRSNGKELYPNLYTILVGEPGSGKSEALAPVEELLRALPDFHVSPSSVTTASLADTIFDAKRNVIQPQLNPPLHMEFHALTSVASEFGVFLPIYEPSFMNMLTKMYDGEFYSERRRSTGNKEPLKVERPILNILGGTTPSYLNTTLPLVAWDQGFTSRTVLVFSGDKVVVHPFDSPEGPSEDLRKDIAHDLKSVHSMVGQFSWRRDAMDSVGNWHMGGNEPRPMHIRLQKYNSRRLVHALKLTMVSSAERSNDMVVTSADWDRGLAWLLEAEELMPQIFRSGGTSADAAAIQEARYFLLEQYSKGKRPVNVQRLVNFLGEKIPGATVLRVVDMMEAAGHFKVEWDRGHKMLVPDLGAPSDLTKI